MKILLTNNRLNLKDYIEKLQETGAILTFLSEFNLGIDGIKPDTLDEAIHYNTFYSNISGLVTMTLFESIYLYDIKKTFTDSTDIEELTRHYTELIKKHSNKGKLSGYINKTVIISYQGNLYTYTYKSPKTYKLNQKNANANSPSSIEYIPRFGKFKTELTEEEHTWLSISENKFILDFIRKTLINIEGENTFSYCLKTY